MLVRETAISILFCFLSGAKHNPADFAKSQYTRIDDLTLPLFQYFPLYLLSTNPPKYLSYKQWKKRDLQR